MISMPNHVGDLVARVLLRQVLGPPPFQSIARPNGISSGRRTCNRLGEPVPPLPLPDRAHVRVHERVGRGGRAERDNGRNEGDGVDVGRRVGVGRGGFSSRQYDKSGSDLGRAKNFF